MGGCKYFIYAITKAFPYTMTIQFDLLILPNLLNKEQMMMQTRKKMLH
jgi:hypothetical protein